MIRSRSAPAGNGPDHGGDEAERQAGLRHAIERSLRRHAPRGTGEQFDRAVDLDVPAVGSLRVLLECLLADVARQMKSAIAAKDRLLVEGRRLKPKDRRRQSDDLAEARREMRSCGVQMQTIGTLYRQLLREQRHWGGGARDAVLTLDILGYSDHNDPAAQARLEAVMAEGIASGDILIGGGRPADDDEEED